MEKVVSVMFEARDITLFRLGPDDELTASANQSVGLILWVRREYAKAEPYFRDYLAWMIKHHPEKWTRFVTESRIGFCLLEKKRYDDAGQLLFPAYAAMKAHEESSTPAARDDLKRTVEWIARLYHESGPRRDEQKFAPFRSNPAFQAVLLDLAFPADPFAKL